MSRRFFLMAAVVTVLASLLYVRSRFLLIELSYDLSQKRELRTSLEQEKRALTLELTTLQNPERVERIARDKLGLTRPQTAGPVIVVNEGGSR
ncbi:MAG: cell division protein FtsL [Pseudomonadota bacterium]